MSLPFVGSLGWGSLVRCLALAVVVALPLPLMAVGEGDPPVTFYLAMWSLLFMVPPLPATLAVYFFRCRIEALERALHVVPEDRYLTYIAYPVAGVIIAAVGGLGVNLMSDSAVPGFVGFLLALPVSVFAVFRLGLLALRQLERDETWPPAELPPDRPVPVRRALHRLDREVAGSDCDCARARRVIDLLLEQTLPGVRARRDRPFRAWLGEEFPRVRYAVLGWCLLTAGFFLAALLPKIMSGRLLGLVALLAAHSVMAALWAGTGWAAYRYSRWAAGRLADQIDCKTEDLRTRIEALGAGA